MPRLSELSPGNAADVVAVEADTDLQLRLAAFGFRPGHRVLVMRRAPLHGPLQVRVGQTDVMLRASEARAVVVT